MQENVSSATVSIVSKAGRKEWIGLAVLALPTLLVSMDMTVMYLAIPAISVDLKPGSSELLWISDIFGFFEAGLLITMGTLGDRIGSKKLLMAGAVVFTIASVLTAFSTSAAMLIAARAVLGITAATLLPSTLSIIRNMFHDDRERSIAIGMWTTCFSAGTLLGPLVGGTLLQFYGWSSVFLMAVPIMALLLGLAPTLLPEFRYAHTRAFDAGSAILLIVATLTAMLGIKRMAENGIDLWPIVLLLTGVLLNVLFIRRQRGQQYPLIDLSLFSRPPFYAALMSLMTGLFSWTGMLIFITQYMQLVIGLEPLEAGLWTIPGAAANIMVCMLAPIIARHVPRRYLIPIGLTVLAFGILCISLANTSNGLAMLVTATILMSGCGMAVTLSTDLVVATAPPDRAGAAAGISETSATLGSAIGIALLGSLATAIYRGTIVQRLPNGLAAPIARDVRSTLGGALAASGELPETIRHEVIAAAQQVFTEAMHTTAMVCAGLVVVMAVVIGRILRPVM